MSWTFKNGATVLGTASGTTATFTFPGYATYSIVNTVVDNGGGTATNSSLNCTVTTVDPFGGNGGPNAGTISIAGGATYTTTTTVVLNIAKGSGATPAQMQFSNDGTTWSAKVAFGTTASWSLLTGDGTKTVYARFYDSGGLYSAVMTDTIILDTTAPGAPTVLHISAFVDLGSEQDPDAGVDRADRCHRSGRLPPLAADHHVHRRLLPRLRHVEHVVQRHPQEDGQL